MYPDCLCPYAPPSRQGTVLQVPPPSSLGGSPTCLIAAGCRPGRPAQSHGSLSWPNARGVLADYSLADHVTAFLFCQIAPASCESGELAGLLAALAPLQDDGGIPVGRPVMRPLQGLVRGDRFLGKAREAKICPRYARVRAKQGMKPAALCATDELRWAGTGAAICGNRLA